MLGLAPRTQTHVTHSETLQTHKKGKIEGRFDEDKDRVFFIDCMG